MSSDTKKPARLTPWSDTPIWHVDAITQRTWAPGQWHGLYSYIDRCFQPGYSEQYTSSIAKIDPNLMTDETKYLMRHTLTLSGMLQPSLERYPNLGSDQQHTGIMAELHPSLPITLHKAPLYIYGYFTKHGIIL